MSTTPYARLLVSLNGGAAAAGGTEAAASDDVDFVYESTIGWPSSPAPYLEIYEAPVGWSPVPSTGWVATDGGGWKYYGTTPPPTIAAPDAAHFGKVAAQLVVGGGLKDGVLSADMTSGATVLVRSASVGLESVAARETTEFDEVRSWIGAIQRDLRLLETSLAAVGALTEAQLRAVSATLTAALPVNSKKITGLANGSASSDAAAFGQIATAIAAAVSGTVGAVPRIASANTLGTGSMTDDGAGAVSLASAATLLDLVRTALGTTKAHDLALRNTTAALNAGATVQVAPSVLFEGHAWTTADKTMRIRISVVPRTSTNVDFIVEYDTGGGSYSEAFRYTTSTTGSFVGAVQCYGYASNAGGYIHDPSGSGLFFGGSGAAQVKSYDSGNPLLLYSDGALTAQSGGASTRFTLDTSGRGYYLAKAVKPTSSGGAVTIALTSQNVQHAVTEASTVTFSSLVAGMTGTIEFIQTTGFTITLPDRGAALEYDDTIYGLGLTSIVSATAAKRTVLTYLVTDNPATRLLILGRSVTTIP